MSDESVQSAAEYPPDADLLWHARGGDAKAAGAFVARYTPRLRSEARRHRLRPDDVEELLQTTFCQFFGRSDEFLTQLSPSDTARPMLLQILRCRVIDLIRKRDRKRAYFGTQLATREQTGEEAGGRPALGELAASRDADPTAGAELGELWGLVDRLPRRERDAVLGRCRDDLTFAQVGQRLGVSAAQAFRLFQAGIEQLRRKVGEAT